MKPVLEPDVCASRLQSRCVSDYRARCGRLLSQTTGWQVRGWGPARIPSRARVRVRRPGYGEPGCGAARLGVPQPARDQAVSTSGPRGPEAREVSKAFLEEETSHSSPARRDCWSAVVGRGYRKRERKRQRETEAQGESHREVQGTARAKATTCEDKTARDAFRKLCSDAKIFILCRQVLKISTSAYK